ncbi:hypothetical protein CYMTET_2830 [Cymbomonas tetramitiformis]|uniref:Uncharacterized protein n=1 Tax=Cymbomonas tetramitiformis TaxID=36881 RepID=A0AAE0H4A1_9CHLO|nr:hypothetical protein CYMTET_2830 [Cymbomonas tetramitiformis]
MVTSKEKHTKMLLADHYEEAQRLKVEDAPKKWTKTISETPEDAVGPKSFEPLYASGGADSRETAKKVGSKRTPSGSFVEHFVNMEKV